MNAAETRITQFSLTFLVVYKNLAAVGLPTFGKDASVRKHCSSGSTAKLDQLLNSSALFQELFAMFDVAKGFGSPGAGN